MSSTLVPVCNENLTKKILKISQEKIDFKDGEWNECEIDTYNDKKNIKQMDSAGTMLLLKLIKMIL